MPARHFNPNNYYVVYKGDDWVCQGTAYECVEFMGIKMKNFIFMTYPSHHARATGKKATAHLVEDD